jgi:competence protein ComEC
LKKAGFEKDELGVIEALLLGERNDISTETYNNYKNAGAVHILAVSGLHIGVLLLLLQYLLQPLEFLPKGKTIKLMVIVGLLWCFAFLAGLSASVVRAVTMFSFVAYALYLNRPSNTFNIIALSMFFILLVINPMFLFQVGFQMSYSAVLAIVWIYPKLQRFWFPENVLLRKFWQLLSVSFAAQLGVLPVSLFYFHQFPGLFFLSNLLVVPFLGLILGLGIVVIALALLNTLPNTMVSLYSDIIKLMNASVGWVAQQEDFIFKNIPFDSMQLLLAYIFIFALVYALSKITFKRLALLLSAIVCFQVWLLFLKFNAGKQEKVILLHQTANTVLFYQKGMTLNIHTSDPARVDRLAIDYKVAEYIAEISFQGIDNSYKIAERKLLILDSSGIYPANHRTDILLLTQSPKINLIRILDALRPKQIVADGSNYTAYVNRWRQTCLQKKLPFHYTGEKGAYYFSFR